MDNLKTGAFIKALRTERELTQRELAERLHITDRAVSKWERGLNAPDIALLEPLAEILEVSVVELIRGERIPEEEHSPALAQQAREVLAYSGEEIRQRRRSARKTAAYVTIGLILLFLLWGGTTGRFFLLENCISPDGAYHIRVYRKNPHTGWFSLGNNITLASGLTDNCLVSCGDCVYKGLWWSPDSQRYVYALDYGGYTDLLLGQGGDALGSAYLNGYLESVAQASKLGDYGLSWKAGSARPAMGRYEFVQWGPDSKTMLIYYSFTGDNDGKEHTGFFWFDCELMCLSGLFELDVNPEPDPSFIPWGPFRPTAAS